MKRLWAIALVCAGLASLRAADETIPPGGRIQPLDPKKGWVEYSLKTRIGKGHNGVIITYQDAILTADEVTWDEDKADAIAEGHVRIEREGHVFTGEKLRYNFLTKEI